MAFNVGDIVKKITGTQKYKVIETASPKYVCKLYPLINPNLKFTFDESQLELAE